MCSESLGSEKVSYGPCAHQESCESLAAMAKFLVIRFDRRRKAPSTGVFLGFGFQSKLRNLFFFEGGWTKIPKIVSQMVGFS